MDSTKAGSVKIHQIQIFLLQPLLKEVKTNLNKEIDEPKYKFYCNLTNILSDICKTTWKIINNELETK